MSDCVFCMIANHEIPSNIAYEDDKIIAFHDLDPQAPVHVLVIPKKHIASLDATTDEDRSCLAICCARSRISQRISDWRTATVWSATTAMTRSKRSSICISM